ncbi:signal peptidase I [Sanguibacter sp. A247]|uniref:signal peptidase I n=1 Tax=Sanguibacter sp. A247 TaxID=3457327 RepID=UPI003FD849E9
MIDENDIRATPEDEGAPARADARRPRGASRPRSRLMATVRETVIILVSALVLSFVVKTFLVQPFMIPSESMEDTLVAGDRVLVSKLTPGPFDISRGDVVVFKDPGGWLDGVAVSRADNMPTWLSTPLTIVGLRPQDAGEHLIKRVVGLPGDTVTCCTDGGQVSVNGVPLEESSYLAAGAVPSQTEFDVTVPDGNLWVLGDNRQHSGDSRFNGGSRGGGFVPIDNVVGVAFAKVWPIDRVSLMRNPGDVFADVPAPTP